eukprot:TRINITY_DN8323_c1_g1_i2.p2 TRINITY_DN8323_c1_g1~~TRINITY_DN8323_c1_g1_i2.p2  ORF type:complete len:109 (+),score=46.80 TRINITY_DN8323_c1_g1_i2:155-481(+)
MLISKANRNLVYSYLFKEGVVTVKKDPHLPAHQEIAVPNLHVMKLLQSLKSRDLVNETFSWGWYYYYLTDEGIDHLRGYLSLPAEIIPNTLKKQAQQARPLGGGGFRD